MQYIHIKKFVNKLIYCKYKLIDGRTPFWFYVESTNNQLLIGYLQFG